MNTELSELSTYFDRAKPQCIRNNDYISYLRYENSGTGVDRDRYKINQLLSMKSLAVSLMRRQLAGVGVKLMLQV